MLSRTPSFLLAASTLIVVVAAGTVPGSERPRPEEGFRLSSVWRFFSWSAPVPEALESALDDYGTGRLFAALAQSDAALRAEAIGSFTDDARFVRALVLADLGWHDLAAEALRGLLDARDVSPYYPLALLDLLDLHHRRGEHGAVADAWARYFEAPWKGDDGKSRRVRSLLLAYGDLRRTGARRTREESDLLTQPSALAARLRERKERPSERLLYLAGLDLFRGGRHRESLAALRRIGILSPYYPYAEFTAAQSLFALERPREALQTVSSLLGYPVVTPEEAMLADRAAFLQAQLLFASGSADRALRAAGELDGDGIYATQARLLRAEICLETEQPSLAVAYYLDLGDRTIGPRLEAERALGLGAAYAALGDFGSAAATLRTAVAGVGKARERWQGEGADTIAHLRALARQSVGHHLESGARRRQRLAEGLRRVLRFEGPLNLGKLVRVALAPHRDTVIGEPVYDLRLLSESGTERPPEPAGEDGLWFDYLGSVERPGIEAALRWLLEEEARGEGADPERPLRLLDAQLAGLEGRFPRSPEDDPAEATAMVMRLVEELREGDTRVPALALDSGAPPGPQVAEYRRRLVAAGVVPSAEPLDDERRATIRMVSSTADSGIRRVIAAREDLLERLEYDLESALSQALARQTLSLAPSSTP